MANLHFITDQIATGGDLPWPTADAEAAIAEWQRLGITHIVDNRGECSDEDLVASIAPTMNYLQNGVDDAGNRQPDSWFVRGTTWIREATRSPEAKVLVHCHMGINRGPSLAFAALLDAGWDPIDAVDAIRTVRPIALVDYAEDALDWFHRRNAVDEADRAEDRARLAAWRDTHPLDVVRIIRRIRREEAAQRVA